MSVVKYARILVAIATCALLGSPLAAFPTLRAYFIDNGLYEDLCQVHSEATIHCLARQLQFDKIYVSGGFATGLGILFGYYTLSLGGFTCASMLGNFLIALGCFLLGSDPKEVPELDNIVWGFFLICLGQPFALFSALDASSYIDGWTLPFVVFLLTIAALSSGVWHYVIVNFAPESVMDLFNWYLFAPIVLVCATIAVAPLCGFNTSDGVVDRLVERAFQPSLAKSPELPLLEHQIDDLDESLWVIGKEERQASKVGSRWFWAIFICYAANMLVLDGFMSSGPEYAWSVNQASGTVVYYLSVYAPAVSAGAVVLTALAFYKMPHFYVIFVTGILCLACPVLLLFGQWRAASLIVPLDRVLLHAAAVNYCARVFGFSSFGSTYGILNVFSGTTLLLLPIIDHFLLSFDGPSRPLMISVAAFQAVSIAISLKMFAAKVSFIDRCLLEREAERSVENAIAL